MKTIWFMSPICFKSIYLVDDFCLFFASCSCSSSLLPSTSTSMSLLSLSLLWQIQKKMCHDKRNCTLSMLHSLAMRTLVIDENLKTKQMTIILYSLFLCEEQFACFGFCNPPNLTLKHHFQQMNHHHHHFLQFHFRHSFPQVSLEVGSPKVFPRGFHFLVAASPALFLWIQTAPELLPHQLSPHHPVPQQAQIHYHHLKML